MSLDDWLALPDAPPAALVTPRKRRRKKGRRAKKSVPAAPGVQAGSKLDHARLRGVPMQRRLGSKDRIWSCDGEYVYFRPSRIENGVKVTVANPTTVERHRRALSAGHYEYVETQDDVEIYRVTADSPFARRGMFLGEMRDADVRRAVAIAACKREWTLYADALEELFGRIKNRGYDAGMAAKVRQDMLSYIEILIAMRGGPTPAECGAALQNVRRQRGEGAGRVILVPGRV